VSTDVKKHTSIAAGEVPSRASLASSILSINDIIPVANATEAGQVATAAASAGQVLSSAPITVSRADAPGLHRIELSTDGTNWRPASGVLHFTNDTARDSWTTTNSALLSVNDVCVSNGFNGYWNGSAWVQDVDWTTSLVTLGASLSNPGGVWVGFKLLRRGRVVFLTGAANTTGTIANGAVIGTVSAGYRPSSYVAGTVIAGVGSTYTAGLLQVDTSGGLTYLGGSVATGNALYLSASWPV